MAAATTYCPHGQLPATECGADHGGILVVPARTVWLLQPSPDLRPVAGFVSVRGNRRVEARVFKPRKWQTGFKPGLQLGEPCLPGHPDVPASVSPPAPKRVLPTPVSPPGVQEAGSPQGRSWRPSTNLLGVFSQEPIVRRAESWAQMPGAQGVRLERWGGIDRGASEERGLPGGGLLSGGGGRSLSCRGKSSSFSQGRGTAELNASSGARLSPGHRGAIQGES